MKKTKTKTSSTKGRPPKLKKAEAVVVKKKPTRVNKKLKKPAATTKIEEPQCESVYCFAWFNAVKLFLKGLIERIKLAF